MNEALLLRRMALDVAMGDHIISNDAEAVVDRARLYLAFLTEGQDTESADINA